MAFAAPTNTIEADLNGTGVLVDITQWIDWDRGLSWTWGRTDWSASEPAPGQLSYVLDNKDGQFTPGNAAVYAVGVVDGVAVKWTCGTRIRWFRMGTPSMVFPSGSAVSSQVRVDCYDAVGIAARRTLRTMYDEEVMDLSPVAYWRLDESGDGLAPRPGDSSGQASATLIPYGNAPAFGWTEGQGPMADEGGALHWWGDAESAPTSEAWLASGRSLPADRWGVGEVRSALGLWLTIKPGLFKATDQPVHLASVVTSGADIALWWDPATSMVSVLRSDSGASPPGTPMATLSPGPTHFVVLAYRATTAPVGSEWQQYALYVDGTGPTRGSGAGANPAPLQPPTGVRLGSPDRSRWSTGTGLAGTTARVAVWPASAVQLGAGISDWDRTPQMDAAAGLWQMGRWGSPESVTARATRLAGYAGLSVDAQGTDRGDQVGRQDTGGQSLLAALCDALRTEDAAVDTGATADLRPWLYSTQRPSASSLTLDVELDGDQPPEISFDTSAVASTVTVSSPSVSATWRMSDPGRWPDTATQVDSALTGPMAAENLAQYRAVLGRLARPVPSRVTVDAATAEHDLSAGLLAIRPGARVTTAGFPATVMGYTSVDGIVVGGREDHAGGSALFTLQLQPLDGLTPRWELDGGNAGRLQSDSSSMLRADITASDTFISIAGTPFYSPGAAYPIRIDDEILFIAFVFSMSNVQVTRGASGTTAAPHAAGAHVTVVTTGVLGY